MASSSSSNDKPWKYDAFLSFKGEDIRNNFLSHLHAALSRNSIETFKDDNDLRTGDEIGPALVEAIEGSMVAVVVFTKGYASSRWCLDELAKIIQCNQTCGLRVIPVFLGVSPSDLQKPMEGIFAQALTKHEKKFRKERVDYWKDAMIRASNLSGFDSQTIRQESDVVDKINAIIMEQLLTQQPLSIYSKDLVGINAKLAGIKQLICRGSSEVRIIGVWGMGGIGKTTIATVVYNQIKSLFQASCFVTCEGGNFQISSRTLISLEKELLSQILGKRKIKIVTTTTSIGASPYVHLLCRMKVLVVLDDVNHRKQLDALAGKTTWFGSGSRIIVTSRDKQILRNYCNGIYELKGLTDDDSFRLFCKHAFKQRDPNDEFRSLSWSFVEYVDGNPLAIEVLGGFLYGKSKREWESALTKLKRIPNKEIQDVLRISYEGLDKEEQKIFLHFACFFCQNSWEEETWSKDTLAFLGLSTENNDNVLIDTLDRCGFSTEINVSVLIDKCLLKRKRSRQSWEMHSLLKEMAWNIVSKESNDPGKRSRLGKEEDVCQVIKKNSGTEAIEAISFNMYQVMSVNLNPHFFDGMRNLKFLRFSNRVFCPDGLKYLPEELRYLHWDGCPLESLPTNFQPINLVVLSLPHSKMKQLWEGIKDLGNLRYLNLRFSIFLTKIPDLSSAPNLVKLDLKACRSLVEVNTSIRHLSQLKELDLSGCRSFTSLPSMTDLKSLCTLDLTECYALRSLPEISTSIRYLTLSGTAIGEVPSSIGYLQRLIRMEIWGCINLESLPSSIGTIKSLEILYLSGCENISSLPSLIDLGSLQVLNFQDSSALRIFPEIPTSIEWLDLSGSAIREVPSSIGSLHRLVQLSMRDCVKLESLPSSIWTMESLKELHLDRCSNLGNLSSEMMEQFGNQQSSPLKDLSIRSCEKIRSLPELPSTLERVDANDCTSLEMVASFRFFGNEIRCGRINGFNFANCFKLDQHALHNIMTFAKRRIQELIYLIISADQEKMSKDSFDFLMVYPGREIPEWITHKNRENSIKIRLPNYNKRILGFSLCALLPSIPIFCETISLECACHFKNACGNGFDFTFRNEVNELGLPKLRLESEHICLAFQSFEDHDKVQNLRLEGGYFDVSFEFSLKIYPYDDDDDKCNDEVMRNKEFYGIKKCGVVLYAEKEHKEYLGTPMDEIRRSNVFHSQGSRETPMEYLEDYFHQFGLDEAQIITSSNGGQQEPPAKRFKQIEATPNP